MKRNILLLALGLACAFASAEELPLPPLPPSDGTEQPAVPSQSQTQQVMKPKPDSEALPPVPRSADPEIPAMPETTARPYDQQALQRSADEARASADALTERLKQCYEALNTSQDPLAADQIFAQVLRDFMVHERDYVEAMLQLVEGLPLESTERLQAGKAVASHCERRAAEDEMGPSRTVVAYYLYSAGRARSLIGKRVTANGLLLLSLSNAADAQHRMSGPSSEPFRHAIQVRALQLLLGNWTAEPDPKACTEAVKLFENRDFAQALQVPTVLAGLPDCLKALWPAEPVPTEILSVFQRLLRDAPDSPALQDTVAAIVLRSKLVGRFVSDPKDEWLLASALFKAGHRWWTRETTAGEDGHHAGILLECAIEQARRIVRDARMRPDDDASKARIAKAYGESGLAYLRMGMPFEALISFSAVPAAQRITLPFYGDFVSWACGEANKLGTVEAKRRVAGILEALAIVDPDPPSPEAKAFFAAMGSSAGAPGIPVLDTWPELARPSDPDLDSGLLDHRAFQWRLGGLRHRLVMKEGGSRATESAVTAGLGWLASHQEPDGHWDSQKHSSEQKTDTACTGLALLAFLAAGNSETAGPHRDVVRRAVAWLKSKQKADGLIYEVTDAGAHRGIGYPHAIAGQAIVEAAGMARVPDTRAAAQKAVDYSCKIHQQGYGYDKGGFRYKAQEPGDLSVTGWYLMQLKSAKLVGLSVEMDSFGGIIRFLDSVERKEGDLTVFSYQPNDPHEHTAHRLTAIGNLCRCLLGWKKEDLQSSVAWFAAKGGRPDGWSEGKTDLYYWYYASLCLFQMGGEPWKQWNDALKKTLCESQRRGGDEDGSWDPVGEYSKEWGRVGQTALATMCLEVYYRYLPIYRDRPKLSDTTAVTPPFALPEPSAPQHEPPAEPAKAGSVPREAQALQRMADELAAPPPMAEETYLARLKAGKAAEEAELWPEAERQYGLAMAEKPNDIIARTGLTNAQFKLGLMYKNGNGVTKDLSAAAMWFRKAAELGHAPSQTWLGVFYKSGLGVEKDPKQAIEWYKKAARQGEAFAQANLGVSYRDGSGIDKDEVTAKQWFRLAAEQGHADAQNNLGCAYLDEDEAEAIKWFRKAAEQNNREAQGNLGRCYSKGRGVAKDQAEAVKWYRKAAAQGLPEALEELKSLGIEP